MPSNDRTQGILSDSLWRLMYQMSIPAIIGMSINGVNAFVDALFVGQFIGQDALAAISLAFPLTMITNGFAAMVGIGTSSLLSRALGSGDLKIQRKSFGTLTTLSVIIAIIIGSLGYYFAEDLIRFMGGSGNILDLGVRYYEIMMLGAFFRIFAVAANMLIRAEGKIKEAMLIALVAPFLNMILNPFFLGYLEWGIEGAAWATILSMAVFTLFDLIYFARGKTSYAVSLTDFNLDSKMLRPIFAVGVSAMMLQIMFFVQQAVVFKSLAYYGDDWDLAFMGACYRIVILMVIPIFGFAQAFQPIAGINYGAENYDRVKASFKIFTISSTILLLTTWTVAMIFPETILAWMLPDTLFESNDIFNFRMMISINPVFALFFMGATLFQAVGNAKFAFTLQLGRELFLYVPALLLFPLIWGADGIYYAGIPANIIVTFLAVIMVARQFRKWE